jgi:hypothetical protein
MGSWTKWRPWLALIGIVFVNGTVLGEKILRLSSYLTSLQLGMGLWEPDLSEIVFVVALVLAFCVWSWLAGFVLGALSGRAIWVNGALLYLVVNNAYLVLIGSVRRGSPHAPPAPQFMLDIVYPRVDETFLFFALPALWGLLHFTPFLKRGRSLH